MPNLTCGIVGLPNVGKSTLFNALMKQLCAAAENYPFCTIDPNIGVVEVYDPRLKELAVLSKSKKIVYATVSFVDIAGLVKGASKGEGLGNQFLSHIRETDAIVQVVRCFEDPNIVHVAGAIDPISDVETIKIELILADLQMAENCASKIEKQAKGKKEMLPLVALFQKIIGHLNQTKPLRLLALTDEEKDLITPYSFLTQKPMFYIANIHEKDLSSMDNPFVRKLKEYADKENSFVIPICAKLEEDLANLGPEETKEFLASYNLESSGLDRLTQAAFKMLNLITFLTTGEMETKAWTIRKGTTAAEAAGTIHGDLQKGFIRAEVVSYDDMIKYHGRIGAREAGKARSEGKEYLVQDGDVILFFHN